MKCVQCGHDLTAPERSEFRDERKIRPYWRCCECDCCFETNADAEAAHLVA
jgi:hypothetical protein